MSTEAPKKDVAAEKSTEKPAKKEKSKKKTEKKAEKKVDATAAPAKVQEKKPAAPKAEKKEKTAKKVEKVKKPVEKKLAEKEKKRAAFMIDCSLPVKDKVFQAKELVEYFLNKIKVAGKTKNLGKSVGVACDDGKKIRVNAEVPLAKRYLKYLAKKFLKKQEVRDYLRLVAPNKSTYEFKYFKMESSE